MNMHLECYFGSSFYLILYDEGWWNTQRQKGCERSNGTPGRHSVYHSVPNLPLLLIFYLLQHLSTSHRRFILWKSKGMFLVANFQSDCISLGRVLYVLLRCWCGGNSHKNVNTIASWVNRRKPRWTGFQLWNLSHTSHCFASCLRL